MSYTSITDAEVFAYTRERRAQDHARRLAALVTKHGPTLRLVCTRPEFIRTIAETPAPAKRHKKWKRAAPVNTSDRITFRAEREKYNLIHRERIITAQRGCCYLCSLPFTCDNPATMDHVWPRARGGKNANNLLAAHQLCNGAKSDRPPTAEEMAYLQQINALLADKPKELERLAA